MAFALVLLAAVAALAVSVVTARRRTDAPTQPRVSVPAQLDRADFVNPDLPWLVVVFSSTTCDSCPGVVAKAAVLQSDVVAFESVPFQERRDLHKRYAIDGVPLTLLADDLGVVRRHFVGAVTATDLWAALADVREPGRSTHVCGHH
jgi:hypothetical protein